MRKLAIYIFLLLVALVACNKKDDSSTPETASKEIVPEGVNIGVMPTIDCLPLYVAYDRGWLDEAGVSVNLVPFTAHMDIDTALVGKSLDGAFTELFRTEYITKKQGVKFYYASSTELQWNLIANKDTRLTRLEQLGDKMIAMTRFSATDFLSDKAFADVKTQANVYRVQVNDIGVRYAMLSNNQMDTGWLPEPLFTMAVLNGHRVLKPTKQKDKFGVLAFREKYSKTAENKEKITQLKKVYDRACDSLNKYGFKSYAPELLKYCSADTSVVNRLPKITYIHTEKPADETLAKVHEYLK